MIKLLRTLFTSAALVCGTTASAEGPELLLHVPIAWGDRLDSKLCSSSQDSILTSCYVEKLAGSSLPNSEFTIAQYIGTAADLGTFMASSEVRPYPYTTGDVAPDFDFPDFDTTFVKNGCWLVKITEGSTCTPDEFGNPVITEDGRPFVLSPPLPQVGTLISLGELGSESAFGGEDSGGGIKDQLLRFQNAVVEYCGTAPPNGCYCAGTHFRCENGVIKQLF